VQGLEIRTGAGADEQRSVLPWDFVRAVEGQTGTAGLGEYLDLGEDLWRARIRIERGDFALAKPMLAKHWQTGRPLRWPRKGSCAARSRRTTCARPRIRGSPACAIGMLGFPRDFLGFPR